MTTTMKYRSSIQIMADVLQQAKESGVEGTKPTALLSRANLSHSRFKDLIDKLTSVGLMNGITYDGKKTYVITEKGTLYLEEYRKFDEMAKSFGLEM